MFVIPNCPAFFTVVWRSIVCQNRFKFVTFKSDIVEFDAIAIESYLHTQAGFTGHDCLDVDATDSPKREELLECAGVFMLISFCVLSFYRFYRLYCIAYLSFFP